MQAYYLNRSDRRDRDFLYRGAMACAGFTANSLQREDALLKEDYPTREALCEAAECEFPAYFRYHKESDATYPGIGHLVCSWGTMRAWRRIAQGRHPAVFTCDDYYVKSRQKLEQLLSSLGGEANIIQLAHHARDDLFLRDEHDLEMPYQFGSYRWSHMTPDVYEGMAYSSSDNLYLSPYGAQTLLDYLAECPALNTECATQGMHQAWLHGKFRRVSGTFSVVDNDTAEQGIHVMRNNGWIGHLVEYTSGAMSDIGGFY